MSTVVATTETQAQAEETGRVNLDLPQDCIDWLDLTATREKIRTGASRPAKSPIVRDLIRKAMAEERKVAEEQSR